MLRKVTSAATTRTHHPATSVQKRSLFKTTAECAKALRTMPIDRECRRNVEKIKETYQIDLALEAKAIYDTMPFDAAGKPTVETVTMAAAHELSIFLMGATDFLDFYNVTDPRMSLLGAINPSHLQRLIESFNETFVSLPAEDRLRLATVIQTRAFEELGTPISASERALSLTTLAHLPQLDREEVLALVDYAHCTTGQFMPINSGLRLWKHHQIPQGRDLVACVTDKMQSGLDKLAQHEDFIHQGVLYKGVALNNPSGPLRRSFLVPGETITPTPHPTSATSDKSQSYADPPTFPAGAAGRDSEVVYLDTPGIRIHLFNNKETVEQKEVLIPAGMAMTCLSLSEVPADLRERSHRHPVYFLKPVQAGNPSEAGLSFQQRV